MANPKEAQVGLPPSEPITTLERVDLVRGWQTQTLDTLLGLPEAAVAQRDKFIEHVTSDKIQAPNALDFIRNGLAIGISFETSTHNLRTVVSPVRGRLDTDESVEILSNSALTGNLDGDGFFYASSGNGNQLNITPDDTLDTAEAKVGSVSASINRLLGLEPQEVQTVVEPGPSFNALDAIDRGEIDLSGINSHQDR